MAGLFVSLWLGGEVRLATVSPGDVPGVRLRLVQPNVPHESNFDGTIKIKNKNVTRNSDGDLIAMARNLIVAVLDPDGTERAVHRVPYGARLKVDDDQHINRGARIAEWDPYTRPMMTCRGHRRL